MAVTTSAVLCGALTVRAAWFVVGTFTPSSLVMGEITNFSLGKKETQLRRKARKPTSSMLHCLIARTQSHGVITPARAAVACRRPGMSATLHWSNRSRGALVARRPCSTNPAAQVNVNIGVVEYCDNIGDIWDGMASCLRDSSAVRLSYVKFQSYESLAEALLARRVEIAWNGNLAHVRLQRRVPGLVSLAMRDTDRDFQSVLVSKRRSAPLASAPVDGMRIAAGTLDSAQAYILPFYFLGKLGVDLKSLAVTRFDRDVGKHGDTALGEELALDAVMRGNADACVVSEMMFKRGVDAGKVHGLNVSAPVHVCTRTHAPKVLHRFPGFDHCVFDALPDLDRRKAGAFAEALFAMDMRHPEQKKVMLLEGIRERWMPPREEKYADLRAADASRPVFASLSVSARAEN